jgi:hypothetical protein
LIGSSLKKTLETRQYQVFTPNKYKSPYLPTYLPRSVQRGQVAQSSIWCNVGVLLGTFWGTHWELEEPGIQQLPHPPLKRKKMGALGCMLAHLIGCQEILYLLVFFIIFGLGYWQGHNCGYLCYLY